MQRIIFFTADAVPTVGETADIDKLKAAALAPYEVLVVNARSAADYGVGRLIPGDFVAGAVPAAYEVEVEEERVYPEIDPDNLPVLGLTDEQAVVNDGDELEVEGGTVAFTVTDGVLSATFTADEP